MYPNVKRLSFTSIATHFPILRGESREMWTKIGFHPDLYVPNVTKDNYSTISHTFTNTYSIAFGYCDDVVMNLYSSEW